MTVLSRPLELYCKAGGSCRSASDDKGVAHV